MKKALLTRISQIDFITLFEVKASAAFPLVVELLSCLSQSNFRYLSKGKIERWHRTCREQFLREIAFEHIQNLGDLNTRLWIWIEKLYHQTPHQGFSPAITPLERWQRDLPHIQQLASLSGSIDSYFYHRHKRQIRKDGTLSWKGQCYEVPYQYAGQ